MPVIELKRTRAIRSKTVKLLAQAGELSPTQREFLAQGFTGLAALISSKMEYNADDRTLADIFDAVCAVRDLSIAVLQEPEAVGLCRLELAKQLGKL